jgi:hypothetical protein
VFTIKPNEERDQVMPTSTPSNEKFDRNDFNADSRILTKARVLEQGGGRPATRLAESLMT